jgi:isoleucyl-tRNA synthetase
MVTLTVLDKKLLSLIQQYLSQLPAIFITSDVLINQDNTGLPEWEYRATAEVDGTNVEISVLPPRNQKCPRCWQFTSKESESLCNRCEHVLNKL